MNKEFSCVAELEQYIVKGKFPIKVGIIGKWKPSGENIKIVGVFVPTGLCNSMLPRLYIRWRSGKSKGLFRKGLAGCTGHPIDPRRVRGLPKVK